MTRVVCYVARSHGLTVLRYLLRKASRYEVAAVVTHRLKPRTEDPKRGERVDFADFAALAHKHGVPFFTVDNKREDLDVVKRLAELEYDVLLSCNWRRYFTPGHLSQPKLGGVNLHRGKLPDFAGAHPVARSLALGKTRHCFTAHVLTDEVDGGRVLAERWVSGVTFDEVMGELDKVAPSVAALGIAALRMARLVEAAE